MILKTTKYILMKVSFVKKKIKHSKLNLKRKKSPIDIFRDTVTLGEKLCNLITKLNVYLIFLRARRLNVNNSNYTAPNRKELCAHNHEYLNTYV